MKKNLIYYALLTVAFAGCLQPANAQVTLNLKFYIEGYYIGGGMMKPVMLNENVPGATTTQTDTIRVYLHNTTTSHTIVTTFIGVLKTNGTIICTFPSSVLGNSYYIDVKHRNVIETWSANPVAMTAITNYNFTTAASQAYGGVVMTQVQPGVWAFSSGDINQDGNIDLIDFPPLDYGINNGLWGYYAADLNGDGNVDMLDFVILDAHL